MAQMQARMNPPEIATAFLRNRCLRMREDIIRDRSRLMSVSIFLMRNNLFLEISIEVEPHRTRVTAEAEPWSNEK